VARPIIDGSQVAGGGIRRRALTAAIYADGGDGGS
jgi:hypothetical protein